MITKSRIAQAIIETQAILTRCNRYSADLRDHKMIATYEAHMARLVKMLETATA